MHTHKDGAATRWVNIDVDIFYTPDRYEVMATTGPQDNALFTKALKGLLRPLARALIAKGMTAPAFYQLVKQLFVEVAESEFALDGKRPTDSRISMLTGVHRRDVKTFRDPDLAEERAARRKVTTIATVLGRWAARGEGGPPPTLSRDGEGGFEELVAEISRDIRPRTVLDEMIAQGLVEERDDGALALAADAFIGPGDNEQRVYFFAENVGDHLAAAVDNLLADEPRFMERAVFYNRLSAASIDEVEALARKLSGAALTDVNATAQKRQSADVENGEGDGRFRFGVFFYREDEPAPDEPATEGDARSGPKETDE
ncbi:MAG: DUF6502 family protein [Pseudomonadota bacterium]